MNQDLDIVIPIYNEENNIHPLVSELHKKLKNYFRFITLYFVDDGSSDNTESVFQNFEQQTLANLQVKYIKLSRNYGKEIAVKCGIDHSTADLCAIMDGDLQHPPEKIIEALEKIQSGYDIVYISKFVRKESFVKRAGTYGFKKLINHYSSKKIFFTDFTLLDRKSIESIKRYNESDFYLRGILSQIGHKETEIFYVPNQRNFGKTKFSFVNLLRLAINAVISISAKPLNIAIYIGFLVSLLSFCFGFYLLVEKLFFRQTIPGFATLSVGLFFLTGIQIFIIGMIGKYIGKIFMESKKRPIYIIDYMLDDIRKGLPYDKKEIYH